MVYPEVVEVAIERAMAYLRTRLSGEELRRYEEYYGVFRDYGADEVMRHYKSFIIMQRFAAEAWRELSERFLEVFRIPCG
jgi:N-glycosylase/DNA lyase